MRQSRRFTLMDNVLREYPLTANNQAFGLVSVYTSFNGGGWTTGYWNGTAGINKANKVVGTGLSNGNDGFPTRQSAYRGFTVPAEVGRGYLKTFSIKLSYMYYSVYSGHSLAWAISDVKGSDQYKGSSDWDECSHSLIGGTFEIGTGPDAMKTYTINVDLDPKKNKNILEKFSSGKNLYLYLWEDSEASKNMNNNTNIHLCHSNGSDSSPVITFSFSKYLK